MIERRSEAGIEVVTLNHGAVNALDREFLIDISETFRALEEEEPQAVVLTGAGPAFSAGADLLRVLEGGPEYIEASVGALSDAFEAAFRFSRPLVGAINGHAIAGGAIFACACDHRIMSRGSGVVGLTELAVGVPFPTYAYEIVRFAVGRRRLQEVIYFGRNYSPEEAVELGLMDEIVIESHLMDRSFEVARRLARIPRGTFEVMKRALRREAVAAIERHAPTFDPRVKEIWCSEEVRESIAGFVERLQARGVTL